MKTACTLLLLVLVGVGLEAVVPKPIARLALWTVITSPASLTADGRFVAIESEAPLLPIDTNGSADVYVLDRQTNRLSLESIALDGGPANGTSRAPRISADGRWIVFESSARNLVPNSSSRTTDLFLRDRMNQTTRRLVSTGGDDGTTTTGYEPAISADGRVVAFTSHAAGLKKAATAGASDIIVVNTDSGVVSHASVMSDGTRPATGSSFAPSVSADGQVISFTSTADLLTGGPKLAEPQVFVRDLARGVTRLVSASVKERVPNGASFTSSISGDGRFVAFASAASDLGPADDNRQADIYLRDLETGAITLVSRTPQGKAANGASSVPAISADGQFVAFVSTASDLICAKKCSPDTIDNNLLPDVYLADLRATQTQAQIQRVSGGADGVWWTASAGPALDAHGRVVVFASREPICARDLEGDFDLFAWIRAAADGS
jgi:Tol biopolymer transport system component